MSGEEWRSRGACREPGIDPDLFFPFDLRGKARQLIVAEAKGHCHRCPVMAECREWAIPHQEWGVAGGLDENERSRLRGKTPPGKRNDVLAPVPALPPETAEEAARLTRSQRRAFGVAWLIDEGRSTSWVAARLGVDLRTAQRWHDNARSAAGAHDRVAARTATRAA